MSSEIPFGRTQLAIETIGMTASLAVLDGSEPIFQRRVDGSLSPGSPRSAALLATELRNAIAWIQSSQRSVDLVSVAIGPGSFTGLRVGVTTAKAFCYARSLPLVTVDSLAAIAATVMHDHAACRQILIGLNAYRGQRYRGRFDRDDAMSIAEFHSDIVTDSQWNDELRGISDAVCVAGDQTVLGSASIDESTAIAKKFLQRESVDAVGVGLVGRILADRGEFTDVMTCAPRYLKPSAAEEKAARNP